LDSIQANVREWQQERTLVGTRPRR
jgi:hypothetical protein